MNESVVKLRKIMQDVASQINGKFVMNETLENCAVFTDDLVIQYRQPTRYVTAAMSVMAPIDLPENLHIIIDRYNKVSIAKRYYMNDIFDVIVGNNDPLGCKLVDGLIADIQFLTRFTQLFDKEFQIEIKNQTITVYDYTAVGGIFDTMNSELLLRMVNIAKELKEAIEYYLKRNPTSF